MSDEGERKKKTEELQRGGKSRRGKEKQGEQVWTTTVCLTRGDYDQTR